MRSSISFVRSLDFRRVLAAGILATLLAAPVAAAEIQVTFVETFDGGANEGAWTYGTGNEYFLDLNGNPGWYLRDSSLVSFTPLASTSFGVPSLFTGDYRARGVVSVGIDLAIASVSGNVSTRKLTLRILNDNGTPFDLTDDWGAYKTTDLSLPPTGVIGLAAEADILQWRSYDIPVPSGSGPLPKGWAWIAGNQPRGGGGWSRLMRDVDHVGFLFGDPVQLYPLFNWDVAMDNPRITSVE